MWKLFVTLTTVLSMGLAMMACNKTTDCLSGYYLVGDTCVPFYGDDDDDDSDYGSPDDNDCEEASAAAANACDNACASARTSCYNSAIGRWSDCGDDCYSAWYSCSISCGTDERPELLRHLRRRGRRVQRRL